MDQNTVKEFERNSKIQETSNTTQGEGDDLDKTKQQSNLEDQLLRENERKKQAGATGKRGAVDVSKIKSLN